MNEVSKNKSLLISALRIFFIRFANTIASLIVMVYFSHVLMPHDYGIYQNFWIQVTLLSSVGALGFGMFIFTYSPEILKTIISRVRIKHLAYYFVLLLLLCLLFCRLNMHSSGKDLKLSILGAILLFLYTLAIPIESLLVVMRKNKLMITTGLVYSLAFIASAIFTYTKGYSIERFIELIVPVLAFKILAYIKPLLTIYKTSDQNATAQINKKSILSLWAHLGIYDLLSISFLWLDKFIISLVASATTAAIYFNGSFNIPFVPLALSAVGNATLMQLHAAKTGTEKAALMRQAGKILSCIAYPLFFFLLVNRVEFITYVFSGKYAASVPIFLCSILILPVRAYSNTTILQNQHKGKIINIGALIDFAIAGILIMPLYNYIGLSGIALSFVISTYVQTTYYLYHSARLLNIPMQQLLPLKNWAGKAMLFLTLSSLLRILLPDNLMMFMLAASIHFVVAMILLRQEERIKTVSDKKSSNK